MHAFFAVAELLVYTLAAIGAEGILFSGCPCVCWSFLVVIQLTMQNTLYTP